MAVEHERVVRELPHQGAGVAEVRGPGARLLRDLGLLGMPRQHVGRRHGEGVWLCEHERMLELPEFLDTAGQEGPGRTHGLAGEYRGQLFEPAHGLVCPRQRPGLYREVAVGRRQEDITVRCDGHAPDPPSVVQGLGDGITR